MRELHVREWSGHVQGVTEIVQVVHAAANPATMGVKEWRRRVPGGVIGSETFGDESSAAAAGAGRGERVEKVRVVRRVWSTNWKALLLLLVW